MSPGPCPAPDAVGGRTLIGVGAGFERAAPAAAPGPSASGAPARRSPESLLFRHEALQAYQRGDGLSAPLDVVPLTARVCLLVLALALAGGLCLAALGEVEITSRARGVMRARAGVQPLIFETGGVVREVLVNIGDRVDLGQPIVRLDSTALRAAFLQAQSELDTTRAHVERQGRAEQLEQARERRLLEERIALTRQRIDSQQESVVELRAQQQRYAALQKEGLVPTQTVLDGEQAAAERLRGVLELRDELARLEQQLLELERSRRAAQDERARSVELASARAASARLLLEQTELLAPRQGRVESLMVATGEVVAAGTVVARLVAEDGARLVTAFVPERDRAFVRLGASAHVELDQLPFGEFGSGRARIVRVSSETASAEELARALGAAAPEGVQFRVELELENDPQTARLTSALGSGSLLTVRLPLRTRSVLGLLFEPLRKWLD